MRIFFIIINAYCARAKTNFDISRVISPLIDLISPLIMLISPLLRLTGPLPKLISAFLKPFLHYSSLLRQFLKSFRYLSCSFCNSQPHFSVPETECAIIRQGWPHHGHSHERLQRCYCLHRPHVSRAGKHSK